MANGKKPPMVTRLAAMLAALLIGGGIGLAVVGLTAGGGADAPQESQDARPVEQADEGAQAFESDVARAEYVGTQDAAGNAVVTFSVTNSTDRTVMVSGENVVVNGQYAVEALGGATVPIGPGQTGAVSLTFGVSVQTPLGGTSEMETLSADLVLRDNDTFNVLGSVPVSVTL